MHRRIEIFICADDERVVPAHFKRKNFLRLRSELLVQLFTDSGTAGKKQTVDIGVPGQRDTGIAPPLHQIENAHRKSRFVPNFNRCFRRCRCQFARFEHDGVAGQ